MQNKIFEVVLKIHMHCEGCAEDIKYRIHKIQGTFSLILFHSGLLSVLLISLETPN